MKKILITSIAVIFVLSGIYINSNTKETEAAGFAGPTFYVASSSTFTLTTVSQRLLGTSTPTMRFGATIQPINCTNGSTQGIFMRLDADKAATANTGLFAFASSTLIMGDHVNDVPIVQHAVQGITSVGTCTVLVTEWRSQR